MLSKGFAILLELDLLLNSLFVLSSDVYFSGVLVAECDEFIL